MKKNRFFTLLKTCTVGIRHIFVLAVLTSAVEILFTFLTPQIIRFTVDFVLNSAAELPAYATRIFQWVSADTGTTQLLLCAAAIILSALFSAIFRRFSRIEIVKGAERFTQNLRISLFRNVQYLPFSWHAEVQTGDIIQRCTSDVETVRSFVSTQMLELIRTAVLLIAAAALMFSMHVPLAAICFCFIPVILGYSAFFGVRIHRKFREVDETEGDLTGKVQENLTGVRVVRAFGREAYETEMFDKKNDGFAKEWIDLGYILGWFWGVGDAASCFQMLTVITMGAFFAAKGSITLGVMLAFVSYTQRLTEPVRSLGRTLSEFTKATVSAERLCEVMDAKAEQEEPNAAHPDMHADIRFEHVNFSYGDRETLHDLSFVVPTGKTVGILGATGSGKSTVTYLLNRLYELEEGNGRICIGETDIRTIDRYYLRKNIGLVLQEPFLFSRSIRDNIGLAATETPTEESVRKAAQIADVDETVLSFRNGYDTVVGERGVTLSGGQKQRIAIARTLMRNCPILVFDDSTSSVDMETDARIRDALLREYGATTTLIISHRISTLMRADRILVLENGRITEEGTHEQLLAAGGLYSRVCRLQMGEREGGAAHV